MNFWDMLNKRGNITDITIAIRGFGKFSGPCMLFMEKGELEKTLDSLFEFGKQLVHGADGWCNIYFFNVQFIIYP
jgi:hypothetical protein